MGKGRLAVEAVVEGLQRLGISGYEAKAYVTMSAAGSPLSGYEVAKRSGVPRSTVYETLSKLIARGAAFKVSVNGATAYLPLPPDTLLARLRREFDHTILILRESLPSIVSAPAPRIVHHLAGEDAVLLRARELIETATRDLYIALWTQELEVLGPLIEAAEDRKVAVFLLTFGEGHPHRRGAFQHLTHPLSDSPESVGRRLLVIAADRSGVLIGSVLGSDALAVYSDEPAVILVAVEYVRHDIAVQRLAGNIGLEEVRKITESDEALRRLTAEGPPGTGPMWER